MNKKAFTLVELMAVIIILGVLALIAIPAVDKKIKEARNDLTNTQISNLKKAAKMWASENPYSIPNNGETCYLKYTYLVNEGFLESDMKDPATNQDYNDNNVNIKITKAEKTNQVTYTADFDKNRTNTDYDNLKCCNGTC